MSSLSFKFRRGVSKIEKGYSNTHELDDHRVREIVTDVFQQKGLAHPYSIKFEPKPSMDSKPLVYLEEGSLYIVASTEPELKRLIGRFAIEQTWSPHEWYVTNHLGFYIIISATLLTTMPAIGFQLSWIFLDIRLWIVWSTIISLTFFALWTTRQVSIRSTKLIRKFTMEMVDLDCMTEYDFKDYTPDYGLTSIGGTIICIWSGLVIVFYGIYFYPQDSFLFMIPLMLLSLVGAYFLFAVPLKLISANLCDAGIESDEETEPENEDDDFEDSEYLQAEFTDLIDRMDFQSSLQSKHESEYSTIKARFSKTKYAQCRGVYDFVEDETLYIDCVDVSEAAAFKYGTALFVKGSLRFFTELSLSKRAVFLWLLLLGLAMPAVGLFVAFIVSKEFGIAVLVITCVIFLKLWYRGWKQNEEVRRDLPITLQKTGVFKDYEFEFYNNFMFSSSSRSDWGFLIIFLLFFLGIAYLIHIIL